MKKIYLERNNRFGLFLCSDSFNGVLVQIENYVETSVIHATGDNPIVHRNCHGVYSDNIKVEPQNTFNTRVKDAIGKARTFLSHLQKNDTIIEGALNDYLSQNKKINI